MSFRNQEKIKIDWSPNFAYAIGLIASDGNLSKDQRHIGFTSKDFELITVFKAALLLSNKPSCHARGGEKEKKYFYLHFGDKVFYKFLNDIGLTPAKSKTIQAVSVPDEFFADFLRGLFDGDGTFYTFWDKRWPNSFCFKISFASASREFIEWLKIRLAQFYGTTGYIHKGAGVLNLEYGKGDTKKIAKAMYHKDNLLFFTKKYDKIMYAFQQDKDLGIPSLQKQRTPG